MYTRQPEHRVFISYAHANRDDAERLAADLRRHGIEPFLDVWHVGLGDNVVLEINRALTHSDYYVLLWSGAAKGRYWVEQEWTAALARERALSRAFLFVVRLDDSDLPVLLAPRSYLDAFGAEQHTVAERLAALWWRDRGLNTPVMPAPSRGNAGPDDARPSIEVYVSNHKLEISHIIKVPEKVTGQELDAEIRRQLKLPEDHQQHDGLVGIRIKYRFLLYGALITCDDAPVPVNRGDCIDVEVSLEPYTEAQELERIVFRSDEEVSRTTIRQLVREAFDHLLP